jgi:hypothetical protein
LDGSGRWVAKKREFAAGLDTFGRAWTPRRVLHNRRAPVRFLSHLPEIPEFMGIVVVLDLRNVFALTSI